MDNELEFLSDLINPQTVTIEKRLLVNLYLPMLFNGSPEHFNKTWIIDVAKNPHVRVHIVENGKVIGSVPPLRTPPINPVYSDLQQHLSLMHQQCVNNPVYGLAMLEVSLPKLISSECSISDELKQEWRNLAVEYGYGDRLAENYAVSASSDILVSVDNILIIDDAVDEW